MPSYFVKTQNQNQYLYWHVHNRGWAKHSCHTPQRACHWLSAESKGQRAQVALLSSKAGTQSPTVPQSEQRGPALLGVRQPSANADTASPGASSAHSALTKGHQWFDTFITTIHCCKLCVPSIYERKLVRNASNLARLSLCCPMGGKKPTQSVGINSNQRIWFRLKLSQGTEHQSLLCKDSWSGKIWVCFHAQAVWIKPYSYRGISATLFSQEGS